MLKVEWRASAIGRAPPARQGGTLCNAREELTPRDFEAAMRQQLTLFLQVPDPARPLLARPDPARLYSLIISNAARVPGVSDVRGGAWPLGPAARVVCVTDHQSTSI